MPAPENLAADESLIKPTDMEPEEEFEDFTEQMAEDLATCMDEHQRGIEIANVELRWAARAIQTVRLGMMTSAGEFSQINAVFEDRTLEKLNRAMRAACNYLEMAFAPKEEV